jgi:hypothetical protein
MSKRTPIDLENINHSQHNIAGFPTQQGAVSFSKVQGWNVSDTKLVRFRWQQLWVLAYELPGALVILKRDGTTVELPWAAKYV